MGVMYHTGKGVPQDFKEAIKWYQKAAEQGHNDAQNNLGVMYHIGEGVTQDYNKAAKWYKKGMKNGDLDSKRNLEILCEESPLSCSGNHK
ncbi:MAG: tetratricopeptide repeat protein [Desulfofustis sp.]